MNRLPPTFESPDAAPRKIAPGRAFASSLRVPPSKSVTNRYLVLALLTGARVRLVRPLEADDTVALAGALERLGVEVERSVGLWSLASGPLPESATIDCAESGTMARFLIAALAALPGRWRLGGRGRLEERPVGPLAAALAALGVELEWLGERGRLPVAIAGGALDGGRVTVDAGESSQYLSALLMAACRARREVEIEVAALTSTPYVELTLGAMARFGLAVERRQGGYRVRPGRGRPPRELEVEGDWSAACYPAAAAALGAGTVTLEGVAARSAQGDRRFLDLLERMGARVDWSERGLTVAAGERLEAVDVDMGSMPDQVPTLAALAPFARGVTRVRGVAHLRLKESDRLAAMVEGLVRAGAPAHATDDGLEIPGCWAVGPPPATPVVVDPHGDHRIAMSFALVGLRRPGVAVANPGVVAKSYPGFWRDFEGAEGR